MMLPARMRGATRFEFAVCVVVMGLLAGGLLGRLLEWRVQSERAAAYHVVGALRTALAVREAQLVTEAGRDAALVLMQENPMHWLLRQPANYIGEYYAPDLETLRRGAWFFDRTDRTVNYVPSNDSFSSRTSRLLKFKVELSSAYHPAGNGYATLVIDEVGAKTK
ncbi:hypothetical protein [Massilia varians]|uniref:hypothetical protein n=1 Tax=Massilia varians TaxID=457921 RepID=UPI002555C6CB|nr:hypothetical protein [Massilia varians]MDK6078060.1 hypothetical protein [Massilia varians]